MKPFVLTLLAAGLSLALPVRAADHYEQLATIPLSHSYPSQADITRLRDELFLLPAHHSYST